MTKRFIRVICLFAFSSPVLIGCAASEQPLPTEVTSALANAFTRGDVAACTAVYTADAEIIPEDGPIVRGSKAISEFYKEQVSKDILFDTDTTTSIVSGNLAFEQGTYRVRDVRRGVDVEFGDYLNVWRKTQGQWKAYRSMYNTTMSANVGVSVTEGDEGTP